MKISVLWRKIIFYLIEMHSVILISGPFVPVFAQVARIFSVITAGGHVSPVQTPDSNSEIAPQRLLAMTTHPLTA